MVEDKNHDTEAAALQTTPSPVPYSIFTRAQKALIVTIISVAATFTAFASNIYFPAIPTIARDLSVTPELLNLTVTSYMIFQGLSPTLWGAIADARGRRFAFICTFLVFLGACIGLAESRHYYQLLILRCLQSSGSASTVALGAGVLGDITTREERGGYMGIFQAGLLVPLAFAPVLGGVFAGTLGWRAIFWFLTIYSGVFLIVLILFLPETLRSLVGNGSIPAKGLAESPMAYMQRRRQEKLAPESAQAQQESTATKNKARIDFLGPLRILFGKEAICIILFLSIYYTVWQMTVAAMSTLFEQTYHLTQIQTGLTYISNGVGCILGTLTTGKFLDLEYRRIKAKHNGPTDEFPIEYARLRTMWLWAAMQCASVIAFGWTIDKHVHISVPIISTFFIGWAEIAIQAATSTFLVDIFPKQSASATAALNLSRCLMGAGGTAAIIPLANAISVGWSFTLCTAIMIFSLLLLGMQMRCGPRWRAARDKSESEG
ncbi:putative multidrug transporter [Viridothelium virens]|uniref:Putative multidrug transporter n=1 Tax=Viridothelium virens TaxID=1048519 RepID=A0A6A6HQL3_VIRVR|nr:putative multidrug transporter [Viridothelium virens]